MGWKNLPSWLKGGIIGLLLYVVLVVSNITPIIAFLVSIQNFFARFFLSPDDWGSISFAFLFSFVLAPILWFIIGAFIGWLVGKIKSK